MVERKRRLALLLAGAACIVGAPSAAHAHPLHTTFVDLTYSTQASVVTATVKVFADDFLRRATKGLQVAPTDERTLQKLAEGYLSHTLMLNALSGELIPLKFCGWKRSADLIFICMSGPVKRGLAGLRIRDVILSDVFGDQLNVLQAEYGGARHSLLFMNGGGVKQLP